MRTHIYLTLKYWRKHKKNLAALLFAGALLTAVVFVTLMSTRERWVRRCHRYFDISGHYDLMIFNSDDELVSDILNGEKGYYDSYNYGVIYVYGKLGNEQKQFTYGMADDKHDLLHPPLDEGRMPETDTEIATTVKVLNEFFWAGKCGDTITLDGKTYTVVGIINDDYYNNREGTDEELFEWYFGSLGIYTTPYRIPSIFVGQCDKEPLYRIDTFNNFFAYPYSQDWYTPYKDYQYYLRDMINSGSRYCFFDSEYRGIFDYPGKESNTPFFLIIAWIGAVVAVLSVYSILKNVFADRRSRIETLKKIGMSKRSVGCMYAVECAVFTLIQTVIGILLGLGAYGAIFWFKTSVLGEKPYSGFTNIRRAIEETADPFLLSCVFSVAVMVAAYFVCALTAKIREKTPKSNAKPRSLFRCFGRVFRQHGISVVQTISLTLICFAVIMGYMFNTDNGKENKAANYTRYQGHIISYYINGFNMETENIAEYYSCSPPGITVFGQGNREPIHGFPMVMDNYTKGIDDEIVDQLPEYVQATGYMRHTFIASTQFNGFLEKVILSDDVDLTLLPGPSDEEAQKLLEQIQLDEMKVYRVLTKLATAQSLSELSEYVTDGAINIDALNSGAEILMVYSSTKPPFEAGDTVTVCSALQREDTFGIKDIVTSEVKIGAMLKIPSSIGAVKYSTLRDDQKCNFLTTASGARAMGMPGAAYTEIYSSEPMNGGVIPSSAEMSMTSLAKLKRDNFIEKAMSISGMALILVLMVLMGFAAYFNGIGMKIREKSYEISVLRAVGTPVSALRKRILLGSLKIPVIATAVSYGAVKLIQHVMGSVDRFMDEYWGFLMERDGIIHLPAGDLDYGNDAVNFLKDRMFLEKGMWMVNAEIPFLILFITICAVTFILTSIALKKFKGNIANDLNEGRKRR